MATVQVYSPAYPVTRYEPSPLLELGNRENRERLSAPAIKAFFKIMSRWQVRDEDARHLLGGVSNGPFYDMKKNPNRLLDTDRLLRISYLIGIYRALNVIHVQQLADAWVRLPNASRLFGGQTPIAFMVKGGLPAMQIVRRLLDSRRVGA